MYRGIPTPPPIKPRSYCTGCDGSGITSDDEYCPKCNYVEPWRHGKLLVVLFIIVSMGVCALLAYKASGL